MQLFTSIMVCELILGDVIQGGVWLVTFPVLGTQLNYISHLEFVFDNAM